MVKPLVAPRFFARFGSKLGVASDRDELERWISEMGRAQIPGLVMDLVPGPDSDIYAYCAYLDQGGAPVAGRLVRKLRQTPPGFGDARVAEIVDELPDLREATVEIARRIGLRGIVSAEFKRDSRDGRFRFIEVNGRSIVYNGLLRRAGLDLAGLAWNDHMGDGRAARGARLAWRLDPPPPRPAALDAGEASWPDGVRGVRGALPPPEGRGRLVGPRPVAVRRAVVAQPERGRARRSAGEGRRSSSRRGPDPHGGLAGLTGAWQREATARNFPSPRVLGLAHPASFDSSVGAEQFLEQRAGARLGALIGVNVDRGEPELEAVGLVLGELVLQHVGVTLEDLPDRAGVDESPVRQRQDVLDPALQLREEPEGSPARARLRRDRRRGRRSGS